MPRDNIKPSALKKLQQFFTKTLGTSLKCVLFMIDM